MHQTLFFRAGKDTYGFSLSDLTFSIMPHLADQHGEIPFQI